MNSPSVARRLLDYLVRESEKQAQQKGFATLQSFVGAFCLGLWYYDMSNLERNPIPLSNNVLHIATSVILLVILFVVGLVIVARFNLTARISWLAGVVITTFSALGALYAAFQVNAWGNKVVFSLLFVGACGILLYFAQIMKPTNQIEEKHT